MKKIIQLVLFCIFLLIGYAAQAQFSVGFRFGAMGSQLKRSETFATNYYRFGGLVGFVTEYRFNNVFALQGEVGGAQKGGKTSEISVFPLAGPIRKDVQEEIDYIDFSLLAKGGVRKGRFRVDVLAGPSLGRADLNGFRITTTTGTNNKFGPYVDDVDFDKDYKRIDVSLQTGLAMSIHVRRICIFGEARYQHGLSNLNADVNSLVEIKSRGVVISAGLMLEW